jgi:hypothetical protein
MTVSLCSSDNHSGGARRGPEDFSTSPPLLEGFFLMKRHVDRVRSVSLRLGSALCGFGCPRVAMHRLSAVSLGMEETSEPIVLRHGIQFCDTVRCFFAVTQS